MDPLVTIRGFIRDVPDFPKPGIVFKDFTPLLRDPAALALHVDLVVGAESRGFIFGTAMAQSLSAGFVPIRKPGKLPHATAAQAYELEYGTDRVEIHVDAIAPGQRVLLVDDLLATGGTMDACCKLVRGLKATIVGISVLIELDGLRGRDRLKAYGDVHAVLNY
jgi:adenine phosphoribosyltransferase